jgi:hypothetical protein
MTQDEQGMAAVLGHEASGYVINKYDLIIVNNNLINRLHTKWPGKLN